MSLTVGELRILLQEVIDDYPIKVRVPGGDFVDDIAEVLFVESLTGNCEWVEVRVASLG
jgi:hypothetical protein